MRSWGRGRHPTGTVLAGVVNAVGPGVIVLGGELAGAGDALLVPVREALDAHVMPLARERVTLRRATLGEAGSALGGIALVLHESPAALPLPPAGVDDLSEEPHESRETPMAAGHACPGERRACPRAPAEGPPPHPPARPEPIALVAGIGLWAWLASLGLSEAADPAAVAQKAGDLIADGTLADDALASLRRVLIGFALGVAAGRARWAS